MSNDHRQISEEELQVFFVLTGSGIWYLQHVEDALSKYITVKAEINERCGTSGHHEKSRDTREPANETHVLIRPRLLDSCGQRQFFEVP